jgi:hypothetical protein
LSTWLTPEQRARSPSLARIRLRRSKPESDLLLS